MSTTTTRRGKRPGRASKAPAALAVHSAKPEDGTLRKLTRRDSAIELATAQRLSHELEVHQLELQMQNQELRQIRLDLEASLSRYTELFEYAPIGYAILDSDRIIREINHAGAQLLGGDAAVLVGEAFDTFVATSSCAVFLDVMYRAVHHEPDATGEVELALAPGHERFVRATASVVSPATPHVLLAFADITEPKVRERKLAVTEAALRDADRRKDDFLSALSHELRNPLMPIRNSVFVLASTSTDPATAKAARDIIDRQVTHLSRLVDDLLDVTRIMRGKVLLQRESVEVGELVKRTVEDHRAGFANAGIALDAAVATDLWVDADAARIVQIISNVLTNAEKFTPRDGRVGVAATRDGHHVTVVVHDTGAGIEAAMLPHLFEPFSQAPQTVDRARGGLGLGLAMVKGLIELHGGSVDVTSPGLRRGTTVTLVLPAVPRPRPSALAMRVLDTHAQKVLVVDDNVDAADSLSTALAVLGHTPMVAYTGGEGIAIARDFHPDVVICDIGLPDMDGYAVATAFRGDPALRSCYLVALSGYAQTRDVERAAAAGFDRHIAKPAGVRTFAEMLAQAHPHVA